MAGKMYVRGIVKGGRILMTGAACDRSAGKLSMMKRGLLLLGVVLAITTTACSNPKQVATSLSGQTSTSVDTTEPSSVPATDFPHPSTIDNKWTPMVPGMASYFAGTVRGDGKSERHGIVSIVTDLTKVVDGVEARVVWERDFANGVLEESELFFVAQDSTGTVWLLGEYPATYERGRFAGAPDTWISGEAGAQRGIFMPADPRIGMPSYIEGRAPSVEFDDRARVSKMGQTVPGTFDVYHDVLVIDEWSPLAPEDGHQLKYYAPGVGTVLVTPKGGEQQEALSLVSFVHLNETDLAKAREEALKLDANAYTASKVYAHTTKPVPRD
jgi:hypothetical protein